MKTNPEALKKLYEALGGVSADVENLSLTPDIIEAIAEVAPTGGGGGVETITLSAEEQEVLNNALTDISTAAEAEKGVEYHSFVMGGLSKTTFEKIQELYSSGKSVNLQITFNSRSLVLVPTMYSTGAELLMSCSLFGQYGNGAIDGRICFIGSKPATSAAYFAVTGVSVCIPKVVE